MTRLGVGFLFVHHTLLLLTMLLFARIQKWTATSTVVVMAIAMMTVASTSSLTQSNSSNEETTFLTWFQNQGGKMNGVSLGHFGEEGRGILAVQNVSRDQEVLSIPAGLIFSAQSLGIAAKDHNDDDAKMLLKIFGKDHDDTLIISSLLWHASKGNDSLFAPYINILPGYVSSLIHFSVDELRELQDPEFEKDAKSMQTSARTAYFDFVNKISQLWPNEIVEKITFDKYKWGMTIVNSRGLRFKGKVYLAPVVDMFNYAPHPEARRASSGDFFLVHHKLGSDGSLTITADRDAVAGNQLSEDYGDNNDRVYLQYHGMVVKNNPFRCVAMTAPDPFPSTMATAEQWKSKLALLLDGMQLTVPKYQPALPSMCVSGTSGDIGRTLKVYLALLSYDEQDVKECLKVIGRNENKAKDGKAWQRILEECGFNEVASAIDSAVAEQSVSTSTGDGDGSGSGSGSGLWRFASDEENSSRVSRALRRIQTWVFQSIPRFPTTLDEDQELLRNMASESETALLHPEKHIKRSLALRYRINVKTTWTRICHLYGLKGCGSLTTTAKSGGGEGNEQNSSHFPWQNGSSTSTLPVDFVGLNDDQTVSLEEKIDAFNNWFRTSDPPVVKIIAVRDPVYRITTVAITDIKATSKYLSVPSTITMDEWSASMDETFSPLIKAIRRTYKRPDDFHELMLFLVHERLVRHRDSKFWPYLRLLPTLDELSDVVPTLWPLEVIRDRLRPSHLATAVESQRNVTEDTYALISTVKEIKNFLPAGLFTRDIYRWASTILDSRSIWWNGRRHLVPMLDFVNCMEGPDPSKVHATYSEESMLSGWTVSYAVTKASWDFKSGEQVFENYGQPNHIYFTYHGFILESNTHDCIFTEFYLSEAEYNAIDWSHENVKYIVQDLRMRPEWRRIQTCLKPANIQKQRQIWLFLHLKTNNFTSPKGGKQQLGEPTPALKSLFRKHVEERLLAYEKHFQGSEIAKTHVPTWKFLESEQEILRQIHESLLQTTPSGTKNRPSTDDDASSKQDEL